VAVIGLRNSADYSFLSPSFSTLSFLTFISSIEAVSRVRLNFHGIID
jgi:hypothetical protein